MGKLNVTLKRVTILNNGRPVAAPKEMGVGLVAQLVNPASSPTADSSVLATEKGISFRANRGDSFPGSTLIAGAAPLVFGKAIDVPDVARLDVFYVVDYQNDLGPIVGKAVNLLIDLAAKAIPVLGDVLKDELHVKIGKIISEEYGRESVLLHQESLGKKAHALELDLRCRVTKRGVYMMDATGTSTPKVSKPTLFAQEGQVTARVALDVQYV